MNPAMWISKTGVQAQDAKLQAIANNLANVNTVGFKRDRVVFEDLFYQVEQQPGAPTRRQHVPPPRACSSATARAWSARRRCSPPATCRPPARRSTWPSSATASCRWSMPDGDDRLHARRPAAGQLRRPLVNAQGLPLRPEITVPANATAVTIGENGLVSATVAGTHHADRARPDHARQLHQPDRPAGARRQPVPGDRRPAARRPRASPASDGLGKLKQGALEGSNVQVVEEMVDMIAAQRTYEMNTKVLSAADNMLQYLAQAVR